MCLRPENPPSEPPCTEEEFLAASRDHLEALKRIARKFGVKLSQETIDYEKALKFFEEHGFK